MSIICRREAPPGTGRVKPSCVMQEEDYSENDPVSKSKCLHNCASGKIVSGGLSGRASSRGRVAEHPFAHAAISTTPSALNGSKENTTIEHHGGQHYKWQHQRGHSTMMDSTTYGSIREVIAIAPYSRLGARLSFFYTNILSLDDNLIDEVFLLITRVF